VCIQSNTQFIKMLMEEKYSKFRHLEGSKCYDEGMMVKPILSMGLNVINSQSNSLNYSSLTTTVQETPTKVMCLWLEPTPDERRADWFQNTRSSLLFTARVITVSRYRDQEPKLEALPRQ